MEGDKAYPYYTCTGRTNAATVLGGTCKLPYFRADVLDDRVWTWLKEQLMDADKFEQALDARLEARQAARLPLENALAALRAEQQKDEVKLERLLDLYLGGGITKERFESSQMRIEASIQSRATKTSEIEQQLLEIEARVGDIRSATVLARKIAARIGAADTEDNFEARRQIVETLDVQGFLEFRGDQKLARVTCTLTPNPLLIALTSSAAPRS